MHLKKLGIRFPIIQAPMAGGATTPELVAAVSNAGALGSIGAGYLTPEAIQTNIHKIRKLTAHLFSANLFIPEEFEKNPEEIEKMRQTLNHRYGKELYIDLKTPSTFRESFDAQAQIILDENVPIFSFTFGLLSPTWIEKFQKAGVTLIGTATNLLEAIELEKAGIDYIVAQSIEAGGHRGSFLGEDAQMSLTELIPLLSSKINLPIIAAGGIMNGNEIKRSLSLGASLIQLGTAFLSCSEADIHPKYKEALLNLKSDKTTFTKAFSGKAARGIRNRFIEEMKEIKPLPYPVQNALTSPLREAAKTQNNPDFLSMWAGQNAALSRGLPAASLIKKLVQETDLEE